METAQFHRAYWSYEHNLGIVKIHDWELGILAFLYRNNSPQRGVNFLDTNEFSYYWQKFNRMGIKLHLGVNLSKDVEIIEVIHRSSDWVQFPDVNLEFKIENNFAYFKPLDSEGWVQYEPAQVEYKPIKSLIDVR